MSARDAVRAYHEARFRGDVAAAAARAPSARPSTSA